MTPDAPTPRPLIGLTRLMRLAFADQDLAPLGEQLLARAREYPDEATTLLDLSTVLLLRGQREAALSVQSLALGIDPLYHLPAPAPMALRLLVILGPGDLMANSPVECLLEQSDVDLHLLYLTPDRPFPASVPDHDVLFVAVAESDANQPLLAAIAAYVAHWPRPVLNPPGRIAGLSRDGVAAWLKDAPGLVLPPVARVERAALERLARGGAAVADLLADGDFPLIVRPVDSHAGHGLAKLDDGAELAAYLETAAAAGFYLSRFVDYRGPDGLFRKYRIILIQGRPYLCHMAVSAHWMIHYLNAGMADSADKRAEEARAMVEFETGFAQRHAGALRTIHARAGLDYVGIDCAETPWGELLVFEVDSCMIVHALDPVDLFPYKQPALRRLFDGFRAMLLRAAGMGA
ncbi:Glutathione synthase/RimK-type ligase, ATP-grasp superfamily [Methylomagnum ishizawai]|uniref:Glutathione synthase/RimK-type ligase, ATP-grasp superfamily n=1 Tax=Methylomagnum ishizawai TaxID=1760988 RepID=A0A1Y6D4I8_9GAMM|nr:glutathione synthase [Methylomagnum ishizawai]SMF95773.1 Glutathione synthase/RimK-type ligase, ATP-grasp superfamily [Methylomagnum ishizawai]